MPRLVSNAVLASVLLMGTASTTPAADGLMTTPLKPFNVTIRVFDPTEGLGGGLEYVLPVDSPDAEHAAASTMANAVSFTKKTDNGRALPVSFTFDQGRAALSKQPRVAIETRMSS